MWWASVGMAATTFLPSMLQTWALPSVRLKPPSLLQSLQQQHQPQVQNITACCIPMSPCAPSLLSPSRPAVLVTPLTVYNLPQLLSQRLYYRHLTACTQDPDWTLPTGHTLGRHRQLLSRLDSLLITMCSSFLTLDYVTEQVQMKTEIVFGSECSEC